MRNEKRVRPLPDHGPKGRIDVPFAARKQEINLLANGMGGRLYIPNIGSAVGLFGFTSIAMRGIVGASSRSRANLFTSSSEVKRLTPVTLPPGLLRLATRPNPTGSSLPVSTIGTVVVAALAANAGRSPPPRNDQRHLLTDQFFRHGWQSVIVALSPAQID